MASFLASWPGGAGEHSRFVRNGCARMPTASSRKQPHRRTENGVSPRGARCSRRRRSALVDAIAWRPSTDHDAALQLPDRSAGMVDPPGFAPAVRPIDEIAARGKKLIDFTSARLLNLIEISGRTLGNPCVPIDIRTYFT
ncbi:hypothetical protein GUJ93_ZPchr0006g45494 [Zizania palustris]|uniref:Uncharacterized protein n=1 Tax=Zizania palustris TaxID=103762 RepID=A0A8J5T0N0_ZIZPA|nr:hypothetical protein GUJ93_ZPchr0006g45494 [Zizania palustris]